MARDSAGFDKSSAQRIAAATRWAERVNRNDPIVGSRGQPAQLLAVHAVTGSGGIPARSGRVMGRALVTVLDVADDGVTLLSTSRQVYCTNRATQPVSGNADIVCVWAQRGLLCLWELCP